MKVLHVIPSVAQVRGGPSLAVIEMVKALRDQGIDAEITTTNDNGPNLLDVPLGQRIEYQQVPVWFFPRFSPSFHALREFAFSSQLITWLWQSIEKYDLLHVHAIFSFPSTAAMAIARQKQVPYIVRPLGQLCQWSLQQSARKKQIYLKVIEQANLNHSQALHLTSHQEQQEVSQLNLNTPSFILPHGLCIPPTILNAHQRLRQYLNLPADEPIILFLSRLHPKKGLDYLIPALGKLTHYRFTFAIAGSGSKEYESEVESLLVAHGIRARTHFLGFVKGETKEILMQGASLFALTSHSENFGLAVLEALAVGLPVLVTPGVALADLVEQQHLGYVAKLDVNAIACSVQQVLEHPQEAHRMGDRARQLISQQYTWNKVASSLSDIYNQITNIKLMTLETLITSAPYEYQYEDSTLTHTYSYLSEPLLSILAEKAKSEESKLQVLDLGCGNGSLSNIIAKQGYQVTGLEESASGITIARQKFPDCQFIQASIYEAPKTELLNAFDVVIAVEVIEHLFYPKELVTLARKCLKPTGKLIITTPYHGYFKNILLALSGKMDNHFSVLWDGGHIKFFSVPTLTKLLETEGYTDINFKFAGRLPYFWKSMLCSASVAE